jgi:Mg2+ and Co2+ transporter CorA
MFTVIEDAYGNKMVQSGTVTRTEKIKERIESLLADPEVHSWNSFQEKAKDADLDVKIRYNKQGKINGLSYKLLDDPSMKRGIRAKRLGSNYMKENLNDVFGQNIEKLNEQKIERAKAEQLESHRKQLEADRRQQNVELREEVTRSKVRQHLLPDGDGERISITDKVLFDSAHRTNSQQQSVPAEQPKPEPESKLDEGLSIFDAIGDKGYKSANKAKYSAHGDAYGAKRKTAEQELAELLRLRAEELSKQRHELNRQLARNIDFVAFSRRRASKLRRWLEKYYRESVKFVEQHLSSARHIVQKLTNSISEPSIQLNESNNEYRNRNEQPRPSNSNPTLSSTGNKRHAKIDPDLDPASKLSTNQFDKDNQIDDDIPF